MIFLDGSGQAGGGLDTFCLWYCYHRYPRNRSLLICVVISYLDTSLSSPKVGQTWVMFLMAGSLVSLFTDIWEPCRLGLMIPRVEEDMSLFTRSLELDLLMCSL